MAESNGSHNIAASVPASLPASAPTELTPESLDTVSGGFSHYYDVGWPTFKAEPNAPAKSAAPKVP